MSSLLLVIDMQVGFQHEILTPIYKHIQALQSNFNGNIAYTKFTNNPETLFYKQLKWERFTSLEDQAIIPDLATDEMLCFEHASYGCITDEVSTFLKQKNIQRVFICGIFTDVCVSKTAMDMFDMGIETFIISDAVMTLHGRAVHEATLKGLSYVVGDEHLILHTDVSQYS